MQPREALEFLWSEQDGMFELARGGQRPLERKLYTKEDALNSLAAHDRFGPLARVGTSLSGEVAPVGNVVWADIDERDEIDAILEVLQLAPSLLIDTGRKGFWAYWKLTSLVSTDAIESWNLRIAACLNADQGSCRKAQLARLPGSYRPETGRTAHVVRFSGAQYQPGQLDGIRPAPQWRLWLRWISPPG